MESSNFRVGKGFGDALCESPIWKIRRWKLRELHSVPKTHSFSVELTCPFVSLNMIRSKVY